MLKRKLPGLSEEETKEFRELNSKEGLSSEEFLRWHVLNTKTVWIRVGRE
jgi:hypothetical protein